MERYNLGLRTSWKLELFRQSANVMFLVLFFLGGGVGVEDWGRIKQGGSRQNVFKRLLSWYCFITLVRRCQTGEWLTTERESISIHLCTCNMHGGSLYKKCISYTIKMQFNKIKKFTLVQYTSNIYEILNIKKNTFQNIYNNLDSSETWKKKHVQVVAILFLFIFSWVYMSGFYEPSAPSKSHVSPLWLAVGKIRTNMSSTSELEIKLITGGGRRASVDLSWEDCGRWDWVWVGRGWRTGSRDLGEHDIRQIKAL